MRKPFADALGALLAEYSDDALHTLVTALEAQLATLRKQQTEPQEKTDGR